MAYQNPLITLGSHGKIHINEYNPVKVPQEMPKFLSLDPTALNEDKTAHSTRFRIQSNVEWEVTSSTTWCTVSPKSGWGDNWITCWLEANGEDNPRTSNITVTSIFIIFDIFITLFRNISLFIYNSDNNGKLILIKHYIITFFVL